MSKQIIGFGVLISGSMLIVALGASTARAEKAVAMKDVPSAVRAATEKLTEGGTVKRIVLETEDGGEAYSVEASVAGKDKEFTFAANGTLLAEEEAVTLADLPGVVRAAAETYFGSAVGLSASKELAKSVTTYEVEGRKSGKPVSLKFSATGALLEEEKDED